MYIDKLSDITMEFVNTKIELQALVLDVKISNTKSGKKYAVIVLSDNSRVVEAKVWDYEGKKDSISDVLKNKVVDIIADVNEYQEKVQISINEIKVVENAALQNFIASSSWNFEKMQSTLMEFYDKVKAPHIKKLIDELIFSDKYYDDFCDYPAAKTVHHNFYHGLLQHTLEVLNYCNIVAKMKKISGIQYDRLMAIAMLHDWGKIIEYKRLPEFGITDTGSMLGHIFLGAHKAMEIIETIEIFPNEDVLVIINGLLSHHGCLEWGSPVMPKSVEAQIVHEADKMSGDIESIQKNVTENKQKGNNFTNKLWNMGTDYYTR